MFQLKWFILKRLLFIFPIVLFIILLNFTLIHLAPGDPVTYIASAITAPPGYMEEMREKYGFNKPLHERLFLYVGKVLRGDFGYSFFYRKPVLDLIRERLMNTLILTISAFTASVVVGIILGEIASKRPYSFVDNLISISSLSLYSMPPFWVGLIFLLIFSLNLRLFPVQGMVTVGLSGLNYLASLLWHLALPTIALATRRLAIYVRLTRGTMLEELKKDYITTAWCKGCSENQVYFDHALTNALLPIVTMVGMQIRHLFMGAVLIETVFAWPGIGRLLYDSIMQRDYNLIMSVFIIVSIITLLSNLIVDIIYTYLDPRLKYK